MFFYNNKLNVIPAYITVYKHSLLPNNPGKHSKTSPSFPKGAWISQRKQAMLALEASTRREFWQETHALLISDRYWCILMHFLHRFFLIKRPSTHFPLTYTWMSVQKLQCWLSRCEQTREEHTVLYIPAAVNSMTHVTNDENLRNNTDTRRAARDGLVSVNDLSRNQNISNSITV